MKTLEFKITIAADRKHIWKTMLSPVTYRQWVMDSWPDSYYEGVWEKGEEIKFYGPEGAGTLARIVEFKPYDLILAEHIAIIKQGGTLDKESDAAKSWTGSKEQYTFTSKGNETELLVTIVSDPVWLNMFNEGWPKALQLLKKLCEK